MELVEPCWNQLSLSVFNFHLFPCVGGRMTDSDAKDNELAFNNINTSDAKLSWYLQNDNNGTSSFGG